ncbi:multidrug efflux system membrane fusion protein [Oxalobacteraceae bacterium GrIS 1.11]
MDSQVAAPAGTAKRRARRAKIIGGLIAVASVAALGALAWYLTHPDAPASGAARPGGRGGQASTVGVAAAELADIPVVIDALGTVTSLATVTVHAQVSGILQKILFQEGQMVKAGQTLAQIDTRQFDLALLQAAGQRQRDEAQLDNARLTLSRYRTLLGQDSIARQDVDTQAALVKQLEGSVMTDRATEGTARLNLGYSKIVAPVGGRIGLRAVDVGNLLNPGDAAGLAVITQLSPIDVVFAVPQDQVPEVLARAGAGAALPAVALDRTRSATLERGSFAALDNQVDIQTGTVRAKARFANAKQALFPSQFVNIRLEVRTIKGAVMVPVTALRHGSTGDFVYVLNADRTVSLRPVTRGQATVDKIEVRSGVKPGEQVITEGADRLKDGAKVMLPGDKPVAGGDKRGARGARGAAAGSAPAAAADGAAAGQRHHRRQEGAPDAATPPARPPAPGVAP